MEERSKGVGAVIEEVIEEELKLLAFVMVGVGATLR